MSSADSHTRPISGIVIPAKEYIGTKEYGLDLYFGFSTLTHNVTRVYPAPDMLPSATRPVSRVTITFEGEEPGPTHSFTLREKGGDPSYIGRNRTFSIGTGETDVEPQYARAILALPDRLQRATLDPDDMDGINRAIAWAAASGRFGPENINSVHTRVEVESAYAEVKTCDYVLKITPSMAGDEPRTALDMEIRYLHERTSEVDSSSDEGSVKTITSLRPDSPSDCADELSDAATSDSSTSGSDSGPDDGSPGRSPPSKASDNGGTVAEAALST